MTELNEMIDNHINENGANKITGKNLNLVLHDIVDTLSGEIKDGVDTAVEIATEAANNSSKTYNLYLIMNTADGSITADSTKTSEHIKIYNSIMNGEYAPAFLILNDLIETNPSDETQVLQINCSTNLIYVITDRNGAYTNLLLGLDINEGCIIFCVDEKSFANNILGSNSILVLTGDGNLSFIPTES